ncbi:MAG: hypothetical protein E6G85_25410 [Alphaproteobacteria bacterium]|nr:MAG: hypothetical protein E6G85_25410 [Alphaproteobacteria bacterium]
MARNGTKTKAEGGTSQKGWFDWLGDKLDQWVDWLATTKPFAFIAGRILVPYWAWRTPVKRLEGGPRPSVQPGDNVQRMMNLVMPLKDKSAVGRALAALAIAQNKDEIYAGLDNVGTVHFARFVIVDDNICMFSVYDGDFSNYIRDFIVTIGSVFDAVVELVEGGEDVIPSAKHVEKFIDWVHDHDIYQVSDVATDILRDQEEANGDAGAGNDDLRLLPRKLILQLNVNRNVSLGSGYRAYPGYSAAQVRQQFGVGW